MHTCPECGKSMATAGGLEIHVQMAHAGPATETAGAESPVAERVSIDFLPPDLSVPDAALPRTPAARASAPDDFQLPAWMRGWDPTIPLTAVMVLALLFAGVVAAIHRTASGGPAGLLQAAQTGAPSGGAPDPTADLRLAQSLVLDQNDLPDGWTVRPHARVPADAQDSRAIAVCLGRPDPATVNTADVDGVDANQGDSLQAGSNVSTTQTDQQAKDDLNVLFSDRAIPCLKKETVDSFAREGIQVLDVGIGRYALSTASVRSLGIHFEVAVAKGADRGLFYADTVFMQQGRVEAQASFVSFNGHFPMGIEQTVVTRFAHKVANV
jgi:hypothetical protein